MKNMIFGIMVGVVVMALLLTGCAVVPVGPTGKYGVIVGPVLGPVYSGYGYYGHHGYYEYPSSGGSYYYGHGWYRGPRWVPGYIRQVCEDRSTGRVCYDTWIPPHYE